MSEEVTTSEEPDLEPVSTDGPVEVERDGASSLTKMLSILDLFTEDSPIWSTTDIIDALGASRSTGYRYIKALNNAGLLSAVGNGYYMLGSRIIELDLLIRRTDPLLQAAKGVLGQLVDATGHTALLCMLFQNSVLCIDEHLAPLSPKMLFSRGQRRPMFKGAVSKIILAHLPNHRLRSIFARRQGTIREAGLGETWDEFREGLARIRSNGFVKSVGEFIPGNVGIAAPIFNADSNIIGSIGIACSKDELRDTDMNKVILSVKRAAKEITQRMSSEDSGLVLPPRAVG
ncbi:IclR family transcriptional regulator [Paracoccus sp. P2]|uniref:IclR family transcriptional regulator n=1 Tax=Paracoccus sp. P2 TaxID=3248840 RepID=UPI00391EF7C9